MNNNINSELEWLFYHLWTKIGASPPHFSFTIPDTIFYRHGRADAWYFTNKEGVILRKNKFNVNQKMIHQQFTKRIQAQDQVVATTYLYQKDSPYLDLIMQHIPIPDFRTFMFFTLEEQEKPTSIQKFIVSKTAKNFMIKCHYSQAISIIEKQTNNNNFYDNKLSLDVRIATFEGPPHISKSENIVSNNLIDQVNKAIREIQEHILENSGTRLISGIFYFKIDRADNLVLIFATNIKTDKVDVHTKDGIEIRLKLASNQYQSHSELPAVFQQTNTTSSSTSALGGYKKVQASSRPQSNYSRGVKTNRLLKSQECPFCDNQIENNGSDGLDVNINQVLKIYNYHKNNNSHDIPLDLISIPSNFAIHQKINNLFKKDDTQFSNENSVPKPILKIHPNMIIEKYQQKKNDPLFLYESVKICDQCYSYVKQLLEFINFQQEDIKPQKSFNYPPKSLNKDIIFSNQKITSHTESLTSEQLSMKGCKPYLKKQNLTRPQTSSVYQSQNQKRKQQLEQDLPHIVNNDFDLKSNQSIKDNTFIKRSGSERGSNAIFDSQYKHSTSSARLEPLIVNSQQYNKQSQSQFQQSERTSYLNNIYQDDQELQQDKENDISELYKKQQQMQEQLMDQSKLSVQNQLNQVDDLDENSCQNQSINQSDYQQENLSQQKQTGFMMFSKVEQGKEVANFVKIDNKSELTQIKEAPPKLEQSKILDKQPPLEKQSQEKPKSKPKTKTISNNNRHSDKQFQRVIAGMEILPNQQQKHQTKNLHNNNNRQESKYNKMMEKISYNKDLNNSGSTKNNQSDSMIIDWEKEYQVQVRQKVDKAKDSIFKMVDKIESGQFDKDAVFSDSLDIKLQDEYQRQQIMALASKNQTYSRGSIGLPINTTNQLMTQQPGANKIYPQSFLIKNDLNIKDSKMFDNAYDSIPSYSEKKIQFPDNGMGNIVQLDNLYKLPQGPSQINLRAQVSPMLPFTTQQAKGYQQIYKENIIQNNNQIMKNKVKSASRIRPLSSKPPLNKHQNTISTMNSTNVNSNQILNVQFDLDSINPLYPAYHQQQQQQQLQQQQFQLVNSNHYTMNSDLNLSGTKVKQQQQQVIDMQGSQSHTILKQKQPKQRTKSANRIQSAAHRKQQPLISNNTNNTQQTAATKQNSSKNVGGGGGLFDFQNMTEKDIKQIAENADTLIQIIQNIKGSATTNNQKEDNQNISNSQTKTMYQRNLKQRNLVEEPCFEEEEEDECTQEEGINALESQRSKRNSNSGVVGGFNIMGGVKDGNIIDNKQNNSDSSGWW